MSEEVTMLGTVDNSQRTRLLSTLGWHEYNEMGQVLKGDLDDAHYLVFGRCRLFKEKYRIEFLAKPDNHDTFLFLPNNDKEALKAIFIRLVIAGIVTGIREEKRKVH